MDLGAVLEKGGTFVAAIISAGTMGWVATRKQHEDSIQAERKYLQEERERIQKYIDEQLDEMKSERNELLEELKKTRERVAVLESHIRTLERNKNQAIARLSRENEALRTANTRLISELSQCQLKN